MTEEVTIEKIYRATEELIASLKNAGCTQSAEVLEHRLYKVAWTSGSELLEELQGLLSGNLNLGSTNDSSLLNNKIEDLLYLINSLMKG